MLATAQVKAIKNDLFINATPEREPSILNWIFVDNINSNVQACHWLR